MDEEFILILNNNLNKSDLEDIIDSLKEQIPKFKTYKRDLKVSVFNMLLSYLALEFIKNGSVNIKSTQLNNINNVELKMEQLKILV